MIILVIISNVAESESEEDAFVVNTKHIIKQELKKIKKKFFELLLDIQEKLKNKEISPNALVTDVTVYANQFNLLMAKKDKRRLDSVSSIDDVFKILSSYWTFIEHETLVNIVERYGDEEMQRKLEEYQEELKKFFKGRRVSELPMPVECTNNGDLRETHKKIVLKLNEKDPDWGNIFQLKGTICSILDIPPSALLIQKIEKGCIQVTFYISRHLAEQKLIESLKAEQLQVLSTTSIKRLTVMHEVFVVSNIFFKYA